MRATITINVSPPVTVRLDELGQDTRNLLVRDIKKLNKTIMEAADKAKKVLDALNEPTEL